MAEKNPGFRSAGWVTIGSPTQTVPTPTQTVPMPMPTMPTPTPPSMTNPCSVPVMAMFDSQPWEIYDDMETGFTRGTIFPELDLPFIGEGACRNE